MFNEKDMIVNIADYCKKFRRVVLHKTLKEVSGDKSLKTLSAFELGNNHNLQHIFSYYKSCPDARTKRIFLMGLIEVIEGAVYHE